VSIGDFVFRVEGSRRFRFWRGAYRIPVGAYFLHQVLIAGSARPAAGLNREELELLGAALVGRNLLGRVAAAHE
jgi:hypothetical protein